jgi:hypothetical protein
MSQSVASRFLLGLFACISIGIFIWGIRTRLRWMSSKNWPSTRGVITASTLATDNSNNGTNSSVTYGASVKYSYSVAGQPLTGTKVTFGDYSTSNPAHANSVRGRYPRGREVVVYYDPEDPSYAVLERDIGGNWILLVVGGIFAAITLTILFRKP